MSLEQNKSSESGKEAGTKQAKSLETQQIQESHKDGSQLQKINNILEGFEFSDEKDDKYLNTLKTLDQKQLKIIERLDKAKFEELLSKPQKEILQFLIQVQINELEAKGLEDLTDDEFVQYAKLSNSLIAVEKSETAVKVDRDNKENDFIDAIDKTDQKLSKLRGILLYNPKIKENSKIQTIHSFFDKYEKIAENPNNLNGEKLEQVKQNKLDDIVSFLKNPGTIESIAKDLGGIESKNYLNFKTQLLSVESNLQASFDRAEMHLFGSLAKVKLGTDNLNGVNLENDTLIKTDGNLIIEVGENTRNLSLVGSEYSLTSAINPKYEQRIDEINNQAVQMSHAK